MTCEMNYFEITRCSLRPENNLKSDGAKSGLYGGCGTTSNRKFAIAAEVAALVCGLA
jgi:hypothetical protein